MTSPLAADAPRPVSQAYSVPVVFTAGTGIGVLGGMMGLGGAEFRLPLLISLFGFAALSAVILNKAMSLVVVVVALPARLAAVSASRLAGHWPVPSRSTCWRGACWAHGPGRAGRYGCAAPPCTTCWRP
ncbi:hypothetical protein AB0N14_39070 [Streptomyces sp. NPDC051104]|uniref:hypothetical protein n=1 Tax=Streptomyces sp. NPDC051104 TaxID=3155044 RepID=UPI00341856BF